MKVRRAFQVNPNGAIGIRKRDWRNVYQKLRMESFILQFNRDSTLITTGWRQFGYLDSEVETLWRWVCSLQRRFIVAQMIVVGDQQGCGKAFST